MSNEDIDLFDSRLSQSFPGRNKGPARIDHVVDYRDSCPNSANGTMIMIRRTLTRRRVPALKPLANRHA